MSSGVFGETRTCAELGRNDRERSRIIGFVESGDREVFLRAACCALPAARCAKSPATSLRKASLRATDALVLAFPPVGLDDAWGACILALKEFERASQLLGEGLVGGTRPSSAAGSADGDRGGRLFWFVDPEATCCAACCVAGGAMEAMECCGEFSTASTTAQTWLAGATGGTEESREEDEEVEMPPAA